MARGAAVRRVGPAGPCSSQKLNWTQVPGNEQGVEGVHVGSCMDE